MEKKKLLDVMLNACSIVNWYHDFKDLTYKTEFVPIPNDVVEYFKEMQIVLPKECFKNLPKRQDDWETEDIDDEDVLVEPEFPDFSDKIENLIKYKFRRSAFVKLNWHAPQDSAWVNPGHILEVQDLEGFYLLLKSSFTCKDDLCQDLLPHSDYTAVLREYIHINTGLEFRCFVYNNSLIGICAREFQDSNTFIREHVTQIMTDIMNFFKDNIKFQFYLEHFVFDVEYVNKEEIRLIDFSPFYPKYTSTLAFSWSHLDDLMNSVRNDELDEPECIFLADETGIQPTSKSCHRYPVNYNKEFSRNFNLPEEPDFAPPEEKVDTEEPVDETILRKLLKIQISNEFLSRFGITSEYYKSYY